jgi:hypothetical protein
MENKYFTPDIEDIHIGYELEVNYNFKLNDIFHKKIIDSFEELSDIHSRMPGDCVIRVPYLTKEQIEAEGWERYHMDGTYIKDNHILNFDFATGLNRLNIHKKPETGKNVTSHDMLFNSKCKCINDFRKIIKLLGI